MAQQTHLTNNNFNQSYTLNHHHIHQLLPATVNGLPSVNDHHQSSRVAYPVKSNGNGNVNNVKNVSILSSDTDVENIQRFLNGYKGMAWRSDQLIRQIPPHDRGILNSSSTSSLNRVNCINTIGIGGGHYATSVEIEFIQKQLRRSQLHPRLYHNDRVEGKCFRCNLNIDVKTYCVMINIRDGLATLPRRTLTSISNGHNYIQSYFKHHSASSIMNTLKDTIVSSCNGLPNGHLNGFNKVNNNKIAVETSSTSSSTVPPPSSNSLFCHIDCFVCSVCNEVLVDFRAYINPHCDKKIINLFCFRHFLELFKPRCAYCDKLILEEQCTEAEDKVWHIACFCCYECRRSLGGQQYVMAKPNIIRANERHHIRKDSEYPYCLTCFNAIFAELCEECGELINCGVGSIKHESRHWHANELCFKCNCCQRSLLGKLFLPASDGKIYCSTVCFHNVLKVFNAKRISPSGDPGGLRTLTSGRGISASTSNPNGHPCTYPRLHPSYPSSPPPPPPSSSHFSHSNLFPPPSSSTTISTPTLTSPQSTTSHPLSAHTSPAPISLPSNCSTMPLQYSSLYHHQNHHQSSSQSPCSLTLLPAPLTSEKSITSSRPSSQADRLAFSTIENNHNSIGGGGDSSISSISGSGGSSGSSGGNCYGRSKNLENIPIPKPESCENGGKSSEVSKISCEKKQNLPQQQQSSPSSPSSSSSPTSSASSSGSHSNENNCDANSDTSSMSGQERILTESPRQATSGKLGVSGCETIPRTSKPKKLENPSSFYVRTLERPKLMMQNTIEQHIRRSSEGNLNMDHQTNSNTHSNDKVQAAQMNGKIENYQQSNQYQYHTHTHTLPKSIRRDITRKYSLEGSGQSDETGQGIVSTSMSNISSEKVSTQPEFRSSSSTSDQMNDKLTKSSSQADNFVVIDKTFPTLTDSNAPIRSSTHSPSPSEIITSQNSVPLRTSQTDLTQNFVPSSDMESSLEIQSKYSPDSARLAPQDTIDSNSDRTMMLNDYNGENTQTSHDHHHQYQISGSDESLLKSVNLTEQGSSPHLDSNSPKPSQDVIESGESQATSMSLSASPSPLQNNLPKFTEAKEDEQKIKIENRPTPEFQTYPLPTNRPIITTKSVTFDPSVRENEPVRRLKMKRVSLHNEDLCSSCSSDTSSSSSDDDFDYDLDYKLRNVPRVSGTRVQYVRPRIRREVMGRNQNGRNTNENCVLS
ncbi:uncharacterized protein LOC141849442 [Brevipalpus obovatus]|uniref:uncharacterized protein LOC141849442 n=1 Tax=Brevipalpus obovatus TaxID=246614 RepID=UPI003D9E7ED7